MAGLLFLSSEDFKVSRGESGNILYTEIPGFSLILFYSTRCEHCQSLIPIFKELPGSIGGCQFGMINVSSNKNCVTMSRDTITPIEYVPYIILYVDGKPFMKYNGPQDGGEIRRFVLEVANKIQTQRKFSNNSDGKSNIGNKKGKNRIPEYSIGQPLCGNGMVCYLEFDNAYNK